MRLAFVILVVVLLLPISVSAWHTNTHLQMTRDAISLMPSDFKQLVTENIRMMDPGVQDPDGVIRDKHNHYYLPYKKEGGAIDRIQLIIQIIQTKFKAGNNRDAVKQFFYLAHYIADLWTPESLIKTDQGPNDDFVANTPLVILFEGYQQPIKNYRTYFLDRSSWRWTFENSESVHSLLYNEAVNDIAQTWFSVWHQSGKPVKPVGAFMIEHKGEAFTLNFDMLPRAEVRPTRLCGLSQAQIETILIQRAEDEQFAAQQAMEQSADVSEAVAEARGRLALQALLTPRPELSILENSLKTVGNNTYFVARMRHIGTKPIKYLSVNYRGQNKKLVEVQDFKPGEVVKVQAILPWNATKNELEYRYSEK